MKNYKGKEGEMPEDKLLQLERLLGDYNLYHNLTTMQSRQVMNVLRLVIRDRKKAEQGEKDNEIQR